MARRHRDDPDFQPGTRRKLTAAQVEDIRRLYQPGVTTQVQLARQFHVSCSTISDVTFDRANRRVIGRPYVRPSQCDVCRAASAPVRRFALRDERSLNGRSMVRGAGAIDLCEACWKRVAAPRRRTPRLMKAAAA